MSKLSKRTKKHKIASVVLTVTTTLWLSGAAYLVPIVAHGQTTIADLQVQIQALLSQITTLQSQLAALQGGGVAPAGACTFTRSLFVGVSRGEDVKCLQQYLNGAGFTLVSSGAGSVGNETTFFGSRTRNAVSRWQAANSVSPTAGYFGPISQAKYTQVVGVAPGVPGAPPAVSLGTGLTVSAGVQPAATLAPNNAAGVPYTVFNLRASADGDITVNSITIERTGLMENASFAGIVLLNADGSRIGVPKTLSSNNRAIFRDKIVIKAGQTKQITIGGDMALDNATRAGQIGFLSLVAVDAGGAAVLGVLPITGAGHTINSTLSIGSATAARGALDPGVGDATLEVGTTKKKFSSIKVTAGSAEKLWLRIVRWNQTGSAGSGDLSNVITIVDGTEYATVVSSDGKFYSTVFSGDGILIDKGFSKDITLQGDIIGGSARTIDFDIDRQSDITLFGNTFKYNILIAFAGSAANVDSSNVNNANNPYYDASQHTISAGTMTVSSWGGVASQNVAENVADQPLAGFTVDVKGEAISVGSTRFNFTLSGTMQLNDLTNVILVDANGATLAGPVDGSGTAQAGTITLSDTITYPAGITNLTLKGKVGTDAVNNDTIIASTTPSTDWTTVTGQTTGNTITPSPSSGVGGNVTMTVRTGALAINVSSQPTARNIIAGALEFEFARYILDAGASGEDVRLASIPLAYDTTGTANDVTNCRLYDGQSLSSTVVTTGSNIVDPSAVSSSTTFTFDGSGLIIPKGGSKTLSLRCNLNASATAGNVYRWGIDFGEQSSFAGATGIGSGQTIGETITDSIGQNMTAQATGTYTVVSDTSVLYATAQAGASDVTLGAFKFTAGIDEDIRLRQIALQLANTASNSPSDFVNGIVSLWKGADPIGNAQFGLSNPDNATSTVNGDLGVLIPKGETITITMKADLVIHDANTNPNSTPGDGGYGAFVSVSYDGDNNGTNGNFARGADSGQNIDGTSADQTTNGLRIFRTLPTFVDVTNTTVLVASSDLYKIKITAGSGGQGVGLYRLSFNVSTAGPTVTDFQLFGPSGVALTAAAVNVDGSNNLTFSFAADRADRLIDAGTSKTYSLRADTITFTSGAGNDRLTVKLLADAAYPSLADLMGTVSVIDATTNDRVIWSPFSTTSPSSGSAAENNLDWTNGYGAPGFPTVGQDFAPRSFTD